MIVKEHTPKSELLNKNIKSIYFMKSLENKKTEFIYYPHFIETINIFLNSRVEVSNETFKVIKKYNKHSVILTASKTKLKTAVIRGNYDIIGIQFFPLSIYNYFDTSKFSKIENGIYEIHDLELEKIVNNHDNKSRLKNVENILNDKFLCSNQEELQRMVRHVHDLKGKIRMDELEDQFNLSRRTILRRFKDFLHCSFEDYKNIIRFRLAIDNFFNQNKNTTNLIDDIPFYDQSDFINHFKALSGESPQKLLKQISNNPRSSNYFWKLK